MTRTRYTSSPPDRWTMPRKAQDPSERLHRHGKLQPMDQRRSRKPAILTIAACLAAIALYALATPYLPVGW